MNVTTRNNKTTITANRKIFAKVQQNPHLLAALKELFANLDNNEQDGDEQVLMTDEVNELPPLFCPFKDKTRGWNHNSVIEQAILYLNIVGYGKSGDKSLVDTKKKTA